MTSISGCTITNNSGNDFGGGIANAGAMTITDSTIANNSGGSNGGGGGGGIVNDAYDTMTITDSTIANNSVGSGGQGGGIYNALEAWMTVSGCTIANNGTDSGGLGGGVYNDGVLAIADSTVAGNYAADLVLDDNDSTLTAVNTTIVDNSVGEEGGGGLSAVAGETTTLNNSIVALNTAGAAPSDITSGGGSIKGGYNLIGTAGPGTLINGVNGNQVGVANPGLGPLADNGGPTQTMALLPGSPAIENGSVALDAGQATDQRGTGLVRVSNGTVNIGAYEVQPPSVLSVSVDWGTQTAALQFAADGIRLLPAGRNTDLPWLGIDALQITLDEPGTLTAGEVSIEGVRGIDYGPITISGSGMTYTIILAQPINRVEPGDRRHRRRGLRQLQRRSRRPAGRLRRQRGGQQPGRQGRPSELGIAGPRRRSSATSPAMGRSSRSDYNAVRKFEGKASGSPGAVVGSGTFPGASART